jgi:hypothetical protein
MQPWWRESESKTKGITKSGSQMMGLYSPIALVALAIGKTWDKITGDVRTGYPDAAEPPVAPDRPLGAKIQPRPQSRSAAAPAPAVDAAEPALRQASEEVQQDDQAPSLHGPR